MTLCDTCMKPIQGQYVYNPDKKEEGKKFCSTVCMHEYYAPNCEQCGNLAPRWVYEPNKNDGKKFCSNACMEQYYRNSPRKSGGDKGSQSSSSNFNWKDYKGWIIGGIVIVVLLVILGIVFSSNKKK